jgi:aspartokinase/homoserine dehydrogenase 1
VNRRIGFGGLHWLVHKFGGTSVANADCYLTVADILEKQLPEDDILADKVNLAIVVSAMGGKPKTTDLLLTSVSAAAERDVAAMDQALHLVLEKHDKCVKELFVNEKEEQERLMKIIHKDIRDIRDILKTVSLMKWQAQRIAELVSGYGELWSAQILTAVMKKWSRERQNKQKEVADSLSEDSMQLSLREDEFVYIDARRVIIVDEDAIQDGAVVWKLSSENMKRVYAEEMEKLADRDVSHMALHFVITGYVASNTNGVSTTLKRDGSDYSAAIMGRLLSSQSICIWTDVDGVLSADPRRVPAAQVLPEVSYNEAMELAYFGAKVIHPKTMEPAISSSPPIPIYIRNTFNASFPGTRIYLTSTTTKNQDMVVCGFSSIESMALINVEGSGMQGALGVSRRIFATLEKMKINVVLISQASSEHTISFATLESQAALAKESIEEEFARELRENRISKVDLRAPCSIIAAVGDGMSSTTGVSGRFFSALGDAKINVLAIAQGSSERNISAVVLGADSTRALRAVHAAFNLSHTIVRVGIVGMSELGESLLKLLESQRNKFRSTFDVDLQVIAVLESPSTDNLIALKHDTDFRSDSITLGTYKRLSRDTKADVARTVFQDEKDVAVLKPNGISAMFETLHKSEYPAHIVFDCTNDELAGQYHSFWLESGVDVVTANNTAMSGSKEQRMAIKSAEKALGKQSAKYLHDVTVTGGLPVLSTLRNLLNSGDNILRIDGIFTVVLSYIMYRISPPPAATQCSQFDQEFSNGAFSGDISMPSKTGFEGGCTLSEAIKESIALGLTEDDPTTDLNNEYCARVLMVLARELGMDEDNETSNIQNESDMIFDVEGLGLPHKDVQNLDLQNLPPDIDHIFQKRVEAAKSRGCVLRQISSVDVKEKRIAIKIVEVPSNHVFAITPPSCACVRFFTERHRSYPLVIQGPSAGADSTASALLAELLQRTRHRSNARSLALSKGRSGVRVKLPSESKIGAKSASS